MREPAALITGANGEVGHGLIRSLSANGTRNILALDLQPIDPRIAGLCRETYEGSILDKHLIERIVSEYKIREIYHLAALLSTRAEFTPESAHEVNVEGTLSLLKVALSQGTWQAEPVKFLFPSSIAIFGLPDLGIKAAETKVKEWRWTKPTTMYGCNKLYCEQLGRYYSDHYRQLSDEKEPVTVDFRCLRYPGLISADTLPQGGTSDFAPEMIHAAAQGKPYACFVREDTVIPFMVMPDAIDAILKLAAVEESQLTRRVYNVTSFSLTAGAIRDRVIRHFPGAVVTFEPDLKRQAIVDSWPGDVDDSLARSDWDWEPKYDADSAFADYLVPAISRYYAK